MNRVIEEKSQWKKRQWPEFNEMMKELVGQQQRDVEKAVLHEGEYTLKPRFIQSIGGVTARKVVAHE